MILLVLMLDNSVYPLSTIQSKNSSSISILPADIN
jgi:hypothetical protein